MKTKTRALMRMAANLFSCFAGKSLVFCLAALFFLASPAQRAALGAQYHARTLPVTTSAAASGVTATKAKPQEAGKAPVHRPKAESMAKKNAGKKQKKIGAPGFSRDPFALKHRTAKTRQKPKTEARYSAEARKEEKPADKLRMSGSQADAQDNRLIPQRTPFSGPRHTMPHMDRRPSPEISMGYQNTENTATRVVVNPQDTNSPLYRPADQEGLLNSAGVYVNVDVEPNLQLQLGGELAEVPDSDASSKESARGASVGLRWSF